MTWPSEKPPLYGWLLALGVVAGVLVFIKLVVQQQPPQRAFGEGMMLLYYAYAVPLRVRIGAGCTPAASGRTAATCRTPRSAA